MSVDEGDVTIRHQSVGLDATIARNDRSSESTREVVFGPTRGMAALNLIEVWHYRELLYFLIWRDVKVRYKQTILGAAWAVLRPFITMIVFSLIFGNLLSAPSGGLPYPIFAYVALLPWTLFATALSQAGTSLVANANLISKVYFPRLVVPTASVLGGMIDFGVAFVILIGMMLFYSIMPGAAILTLPLFILLTLLAALGFSLWLAALQVKYRDIGHVIPFLIQLWLFATPVAYPMSLIPARWQLLYGLNPMVGIIEGFRWAMLGMQPPRMLVLLTTTIVLAVLVSGLFYFRRAERDFADVV